MDELKEKISMIICGEAEMIVGGELHLNCGKAHIVAEKVIDLLEQSPESGQVDAIVIGTAASEWQTGKPEESGRYLVEYQQGERIKKVFVMDYDAFEERWLTHATEAEVLRWAKINSEYQ